MTLIPKRISPNTWQLIKQSKKEITMETETNATTPASKFAELVQLVEDCKADHEKAINGNKSSSIRVRNNMTKIKTLTLIIRKEMLETRKK